MFNVIFAHGKLYDKETKNRILIDESSEAYVIIEESFLLENDPYNHESELSSEEEIISELQSKDYAEFKKLADAHSKMHFYINAGKKGKGQKVMSCQFTLRLLEPLYLIKKEAKSQKGVVHSCSCIVEKEDTKQLQFFEPIHAYSLNDAYMKTYDSYFALYGKPTINIYTNFKLLRNDKIELLSELRMWPLK